MGGNGGKWGIVGSCQKHIVGSVEIMCEIGRKREENWRKEGQFGTNFPFFPVPFSPLFHNLATFPSNSFEEFCQPNSPTGKMGIWGLADWKNGNLGTGRLEKWEFGDWPIGKMGISGLADISRIFGQRRWL